MTVTDPDTLLPIALEQFARQGVADTHLDHIARLAASDVDALEERYGDITRLFDVAIGWGTKALRDDIDRIASGDGPPVARLIGLLRRLGEPGDREATAMLCVLRELMHGTPHAERAFEHWLLRPYDAAIGVLSEAQIRGDISPLPPRLALATMVGAVVMPQLLGYGPSQGELQGAHGRTEDADDSDIAVKPRGALLAAALQVILHGMITPRGADSLVADETP